MREVYLPDKKGIEVHGLSDVVGKTIAYVAREPSKWHQLVEITDCLVDSLSPLRKSAIQEAFGFDGSTKKRFSDIGSESNISRQGAYRRANSGISRLRTNFEVTRKVASWCVKAMPPGESTQ